MQGFTWSNFGKYDLPHWRCIWCPQGSSATSSATSSTKQIGQLESDFTKVRGKTTLSWMVGCYLNTRHNFTTSATLRISAKVNPSSVRACSSLVPFGNWNTAEACLGSPRSIMRSLFRMLLTWRTRSSRREAWCDKAASIQFLYWATRATSWRRLACRVTRESDTRESSPESCWDGEPPPLEPPAPLEPLELDDGPDGKRSISFKF